MADSICPTFAAGTISLNNRALNGGVNTYHKTVGSQNHSWTNGDLTQSVTPTYNTNLLSFGATGLQS